MIRTSKVFCSFLNSSKHKCQRHRSIHGHECKVSFGLLSHRSKQKTVESRFWMITDRWSQIQLYTVSHAMRGRGITTRRLQYPYSLALLHAMRGQGIIMYKKIIIMINKKLYMYMSDYRYSCRYKTKYDSYNYYSTCNFKYSSAWSLSLILQPA